MARRQHGQHGARHAPTAMVAALARKSGFYAIPTTLRANFMRLSRAIRQNGKWRTGDRPSRVIELVAWIDAEAGVGVAEVGPQTILVVEDDECISEMLVLMLEEAGFSAVPALDGWAALDLVGRIQPAAITLDLELPRLPGRRVLEHLASGEATRRIPIVVLSGDVDEFSPTSQVWEVLRKPTGVQRLVEALHEALVGRRADEPILAGE